jgi:hypothetical protein
MKCSPSEDAYLAAGFPRREIFPHSVVWIDKPYPDTFLQLERRGVSRVLASCGRACQINLYATMLADLPAAVFTDRTLNWHQQQLGQDGLVAAAGLFRRERTIYVSLMQSDLCQQVFRHPTLRPLAKTRLDNRFGSWFTLLFNAILDFALDHDIAVVYTPTARQILGGLRAPVTPRLFERIYDGPARRYRCAPVRVGDAEYWAVSVAENRDRIARLRAAPATAPSGGAGVTICLVHDIEEDLDTPVAPAACRASLDRMLEIEAEHGVRATYSIVGTLYQEKRRIIAPHGHALALHSYNHRIEERDQLRRARAVDLQVRGYRPPRSVMTAELSDYDLAYFNFEWLLSSAWSFGFGEPRLEQGLAKIPVHMDDYELFRRALDYDGWLARLRALLCSRRFLAVGLHDCYGVEWLPRYGELLEEFRAVGRLATADEVADELFRASDWSGRPSHPGAEP